MKREQSAIKLQAGRLNYGLQTFSRLLLPFVIRVVYGHFAFAFFSISRISSEEVLPKRTGNAEKVQER